MKKYLSIIVALVTALFAANSFAYTSPPAPANGGYVLDEVGKLSQTEIDQLNHKIESIKQSTKNEYGIAVIKSTGGEDIADVGQTIFRAWGVGDKKLNNGVLLVIAIAEHKTRIQTGKGVEGDLPDLKANDILNNTLKPYLKQGKFYDGINATLDSIASSVDSRAQAPSAPASNADSLSNTQQTSSDSGGSIILLVLLTIAGMVGLFVFLSVRRSRKEEERLYRLEQEERRRNWNRQVDEQRLRNQNLTTTPEVPNKKPYFDPYATAAIGTTVAVASATEKREADARRRRREEEDTKRSSSSSSSYSSPSYSSYESSSSSWSSGGGGFDGGGFSGGDSGGGGSSGDW